VPDLRCAMSCCIVLGGDTGSGFEYAMKITRAAVDRRRQSLERRFVFATLDEAARLRDKSRVFGIDR
jgi:hypothetical protein